MSPLWPGQRPPKSAQKALGCSRRGREGLRAPRQEQAWRLAHLRPPTWPLMPHCLPLRLPKSGAQGGWLSLGVLGLLAQGTLGPLTQACPVATGWPLLGLRASPMASLCLRFFLSSSRIRAAISSLPPCVRSGARGGGVRVLRSRLPHSIHGPQTGSQGPGRAQPGRPHTRRGQPPLQPRNHLGLSRS